MSIRTPVSRLACLLLLAAAGAGACSRDPEETSRRHTASGDAYAARGQFEEAIIEYRRALNATPSRADLRYQLGLAYEETGELVEAYREFARAADLDPSNVDAQMRAGTLLLVAREFDAARTRAELALAANPSHVPAHILLGNAMAGLNDTTRALRQIEQAISLDPSSAPAWTALGAVTFLGGRREEAAEAFNKAVELAPESIDARLALANYQWASGSVADAERTLKTALELEPGNSPAHRALALLHLTTGRAAEAETHFRALAVDPAGRLALADYYMGIGRNEEALGILGEVEKSPEKSDVRAARLRTAAIQYAGGNRAEAHRILDALLEERPGFAEARTAKARMLLSDGGPSAAEAIRHAREAVKADADMPGAHYTLGLAAMAERQFEEAERAFEEVTRLTPRAAAAHLQLARLRLARGETGAAVAAAEVAARERPGDAQAAVLLSQGLRAQGHVERADREIQSRLAEQPESAALHVEMGWLSLQRRDAGAARSAFREALRLVPQSFEARSGLVAAELEDRKVDAARALVAAWRAEAPGDSAMPVLAARVELAGGRMATAERILEETIASDASQLDAYELLGRAYAAQGRVDDAIRQYETLAARSPAALAGAKTMVGMLHEARKDQAAAQAAYEQALAAEPGAGVAANNLAWIYANEGRLDDALRLATVAQESLRRRPEAEDTLGWVYLQKGLASRAIASFERARVRAPQNPVYHYHLGLAYMKTGENRRAEAAFKQALQLQPDFSGAGDARAQLASLAQSAAK